MPTLPDPKREQFAQLCARGLPVIDAYVRSGYKRNTGNATSLKKQPVIAARIEELQAEMSGDTAVELNSYMKESGITPTFIIKNLLDIAQDAKEAAKFETAIKAYKDLGQELFGMFVVRQQINVDKTDSVHTKADTQINVAFLNQALEGIGDASPRRIEIDGHATSVDTGPAILSRIPVKDD